MTLAFACLTREFVTLVADRRVTLGSQVLEDRETKVVVVCDRGAVAYSGLARFPTRGVPLERWPRMDEWILSILSTSKVTTLSEAAKVLRIQATEAFQQLPATAFQRRHAFLIVGWSVVAEGRRVPVLCTVSNALDARLEWLSAATPQFEQRLVLLDDPRKFSLAAIGAVMSDEVLAYVRRSLRRGFPRGIGPASALRLSVRAIRAVADRDRSVGRDLLGVCVSPSSLEVGPVQILAGSPTQHAITFIDFKLPFETGEWMGPHFVCGGAGATGFKVGSLNPG